jgi:tetratricopeptide (TPR) repeat protein
MLSAEEAKVGPNDPSLARPLIGLASVNLQMGDHAQAASHFERAATLLDQVDPPQPIAHVYARNGLAESQLTLGQTQLAESNYERGIDLLMKDRDSNAREFATMSANLAGIKAAEGRHASAIQLYQRAIETLEKGYGADYAVLATLYARQGASFEEIGKTREAEVRYEHSLTIGRASPGDPMMTAHTLDSLALLLLERGEADRAETLLREAVALQERQGAANGGELGASLRYLGAAFQARTAFPAAEKQYLRAAPLLEAALGPDDSSYGFFLRDLAQVYAAQNKLHQAEDAYGRSLSILEARLGANDPSVLQTRRSYEQVMRAQNTP